jgi:ATP-dependent Clp protease ATP-binding subunit ClpA
MRNTLGVLLGLSLAVAAFGSDKDKKESYVLGVDHNRVTISGGMTIEKVVKLRNQYSGRFLWVRRGDATWIIQDPQWLDRAAAFFADQLGLGPEQEAISREEAELDRQEEELEDLEDEASQARLEEIHRKQEDLSRREEELDEREEELEREAESKLSALVDDAIKQGVARSLHVKQNPRNKP